MALAAESIKHLNKRRLAAKGPDQPSPPRLCFFGVASVHEREQSKGRIAQPAKAIVPIARATQLLREGRGGRCDHAPAWPEYEGPQRQQGADHRLRPLTRVLE